MSESKPMNRYQIVFDACIDLDDSLSDNGRIYGFFHHITRNLAASISLMMKLESEGICSYSEEEKRDSLLRVIKTLRTYKMLLEKFPEFKAEELKRGYFDNPERWPIDKKGIRRPIFDHEEYVEYASRMLEGLEK